MSLTDYLAANAQILARQATERNPPLHNPDADDVHHGIPRLLRKPFPAQSHVITASVKALDLRKSLFLCGDMGTGKTLMGQSAVHLHADGRPYRALVMCPGHLTQKWKRELIRTLPGVHVHILKNWRDVVRLLELPRDPVVAEWYIIGRDTAKLGAKWKPAVMRRDHSVKDEESPRLHPVCPHCGSKIVSERGETISDEQLKKDRQSCHTCKEPLWTATNELRRWPPSWIIKRKLKGFFTYFVADECHELAGEATAQATSFGALASACKYTIAMTGTLTNGKAESLRALLYRASPQEMLDRDFAWTDHAKFNQVYGRIETTVRQKESGGFGNRQSFGRSSKTKSEKCVPGIMPSLFGHMLIGNTVFLSLEQVAENLPDLDEELISVPMDEDVRSQYVGMEATFRQTCSQMLARGDRRLLGPMVQCLLTWAEHPFNWDGVGYYDSSLELNGKRERRFVKVVEPANLDPDRVYAKERALIELCLAEKAAGRSVWVFVQHTNEHDVSARLAKVLSDAGLKTGILRQSVDPPEREQWIADNGPGLDVCLSHPQLVQTGVDFFDHEGTYNFPTLVFYEVGYKATDLRQASRRAWRIGQAYKCRVVYLYHPQSMAERALSLMGRKLVAAEAIEGKFSTDGLAAMGDDESLDLARTIAENLEIESAGKAWGGMARSTKQKLKEENWDQMADELADLVAMLKSTA